MQQHHHRCFVYCQNNNNKATGFYISFARDARDALIDAVQAAVRTRKHLPSHGGCDTTFCIQEFDGHSSLWQQNPKEEVPVLVWQIGCRDAFVARMLLVTKALPIHSLAGASSVAAAADAIWKQHGPFPNMRGPNLTVTQYMHYYYNNSLRQQPSGSQQHAQ